MRDIEKATEEIIATLIGSTIDEHLFFTITKQGSMCFTHEVTGETRYITREDLQEYYRVMKELMRGE